MTENSIICGAMPDATKVFPDGYFNCSISSPPYWGLRDYGLPPSIWEGDKDCEHKWGNEIIRRDRGAAAGATAQTGNQKREIMGVETKQGQFCFLCGAWRGSLGLEPTFELYIEHLCTIYDEVKRVLRADGTCWVNLGDTYWGGGNNRGNNSPISDKQASNKGAVGQVQVIWDKTLPAKSLCLIPQRFAIEMVNRGWILRNVIIWHKPNPMPSSAKDRFTVDFEYVYFFVKSRKYWFEPQYEPYLTESNADRPRMGQGNQTKYKQKRAEGMGGAGTSWKGHSGNLKADGSQIGKPALGRNKRTVWTIPTQPFPEAHFATFPEKLVEPMIKAGCPEFVCTKCDKGREKIYDLEIHKIRPPETGLSRNHTGNIGTHSLRDGHREMSKHFKGYTDCGCNAEFRVGIVLDIFAGSCTTGKVAAKLRRDYVMIDLKPEYIEMGEKRVTEGETGIKVSEQKAGQLALFENG